MAGETTPTTTADRQLAALLTAQALRAGLPDVVLSPLCNTEDIAGQASLVVQYAVEADDGVASSATYGTALSSNNEFDYATAITITVTEGAAVLGEVLDTAVEVKFPGMGSVADIMANGSVEQKVAALADEARRSVSMCMEKFESDHCALLDNFSVSVDGSGISAGALTIADLFSAIYSYDIAENVTRETALALWPVQVRDIRLDLAATGGGMGGSVWNQQADASFLSSRGLPANGFLGTLLGRPLYQMSHSLRNLSDTNANVNGALIAIGRGSPASGQLGALANVTRGGPKFRIEQSAKVRGVFMSTVMEYGVAEIRDAHGIRIRSRAT
jgi:hypothetical protein